jgi:predicted nucleic acid-binding protein
MGTVALLGQAKNAGLIERLKPCLDALVLNGIYIRQKLIDAALKEVGE